MAVLLSAAMLASLVPAGALEIEDTPDAAPAEIAEEPAVSAPAAPEDIPDADPDEAAPASVAAAVSPTAGHATGDLPRDVDAPYSERAAAAAVLADTLPADYVTPDLPAVRNQDPYGTCWAHAALACAEISLIRQGLADADEIDLAELQLVQMTYGGPLNDAGEYNDPLNNFGGDHNTVTENPLEFGGNSLFSSKTLASWMGVMQEDDLTAYNQDNAQAILRSGLPYSYAFSRNAFHLENVRDIPMNMDIAVLKQLVMDYGAMSVSYASEDDGYSGDECYFYHSDTNYTNHAVTIVGWDDTVSRENFLDSGTGKQPEHDGAWVIRNSWGDDWGLDGYFYMSYETSELHRNGASGMVWDFGTADQYDACYQYDGSASYSSMSYSDGAEAGRIANVFTAVTDEYIEAVSFWTDTADLDYTVTVYTGLTDPNDPCSGEAGAAVSGSTDYAGYYSVPLPQKVFAEYNTQFSVVVSLSGSGELAIPIDRTRNNGRQLKMWSYAESGQSFYSEGEDDGWTDLAESMQANCRIKAFVSHDLGVALAISTQPKDTEGNAGETVGFTVNALGTGLSYQWQYKAPTGTKWANTTLTGNKTATLSVPVTAGRDGYAYRCIISDSSGYSLTSEPAVLTVRSDDIVGGRLSGYVSWSLNRATGELTVFGDGTLPWWSRGDDFPWAAYQKDITSISVGGGVTSISEKAFAACREAVSIYIDSSVTDVAAGALCGCWKLENILVADDNEYYDSINKSLYQGSTLVSVPSAFSGEFAVANGAVTIGKYALRNCDRITSVSIPDSVSDIHPWAFDDCPAIESFRVDEGNEYYKAVGGVLFTADGSTLVRYPAAVAGAYTVPAGTQAIGGSAFQGAAQLTQITLPLSVTNIRSYAFDGCDALALVLYQGTKEQRRNIKIQKLGNEHFATGTKWQTEVQAAPVIVTQPQDITANAGSTAKFTIAAEGTGMAYQWQYRAPDGTKWANTTLTGNKTAALSVPATAGRDGYSYRCRITDSAGSVVCSEPAVLTVEIPFAITAQPKDVTAAVGDKAKFTVAATGTGLSYQWQYKAPAGTKWANTTLTGNKTATLSVSASAGRDGYSYRCRVTDSAGNVVYSDAAVLRIQAAGPVITAQPADQAVQAGSTAKFTVTATGTGLSYQWQYKSPAGTKWANTTLTGNKTATLSVSASAGRDGYSYRCRVTDGAGNVVYSDAAVLTVKAAITAAPQSVTVSAGSTAKFTVTAAGVDITYQWQYKSPTGTKWANTTLTGNKTATLSVPATAGRNGYSYRCVITDAHGDTVASAAAVLNIG